MEAFGGQRCITCELWVDRRGGGAEAVEVLVLVGKVRTAVETTEKIFCCRPCLNLRT